MSSVFDVASGGVARDRRQELGAQIVMALGSILRNARSYNEENDVFSPALDQLQSVFFTLIENDGTFDLEVLDEGIFLNRQQLKLEAAGTPIVGLVRGELRQRGIFGLAASVAPPRGDLRELVRLLSPRGPHRPGVRGDARRPLTTLRLKLSAAQTAEDTAEGLSARLVSAYSHAVFFVDHTIQQLRVAGELISLPAASRVVQDLVDLQRTMPRRFLQLVRLKATTEEYWGYHAANVCVLAITFAARLGLPKSRRHDLGMAALFHDVGMAAIPSALLERGGKLDARAQSALRASPLFAARAILRDREVHTAALERALAVHECHLDLVPPDGALPDIGLAGRILAICESYDALTTDRPFRPAHSHEAALRVMTTEQLFRFDPHLIDLLPKVVEPLLRQ
jgi:hypothetical protein